ncbi:MAG: hypothetical protein AUH41_00415 [Gemmatimonadetes bacterium 13_1_40CM_66_11]|nr:MAG: hypothetical protein AUH41_00415 [Gemmatimonadetes bacterium 13_1_40CM_66_11]
MTLGRLRVRLTLWYAATFAIILLLLGAGVFVAISVQIARRLDASLIAATAAVKTATVELEAERAAGRPADAVEELHIPDRSLYLFDATGQVLTPARVAAWIDTAARGAAVAYVAGAVAERPQIADQYAWLIGTFGAATLGALILVIAGGFVLARQSTVPVERSVEQMRRFMADAAHELRTPVTLLRTRTEVALAQPRDPAGDAAAFQAIEREADRLGGIVGDLLLLARADAGERRVVRGSLYLDDVASQAVAAVRALAERKGVSLVVGSFEEAQILGDPELVERLLLIVLDNAIKYTPHDGRVRLDVTARDGKRSVIVSDSGVGIPPEELPRVFERFYRGDSTRSQAEGSGLGLPIARWIADLHNARISVSSDSSGTRVQIDFPPGV